MDAAAEALRRGNPNLRAALRDDLQLLFREIQQRREPELSSVEWLGLFETWLAEYVAKCERIREAAIAGLVAVIDESAR